MYRLLKMPLWVLVSAILFACDAPGDATQRQVAQGEAATDIASESPRRTVAPIGVWERSLRNDAGPDPVIAMEIRTDGTYSVSGIPMVEDRGSWSAEVPGVLAFTSDVSPNRSRILAVRMDGEDALTLFTDIPFPYSEVWIRKLGAPNFPSVAINGVDIPEALSLLMASAHAAEARPWREDALPTWIRVERSNDGGYQIALHFFSPSATEGMEIRVTEYGTEKSVYDGSRAAAPPLPPVFMDLPRIVEAAAAQGFNGALRRADVRVYEGHGPAWMAFFDGAGTGAGTGATFSAMTGERVYEDVTGYIAQYEADWNRMAGVWRQMLDQYKEDDDYGPCEPIEVWGRSCLPSNVLEGIVRRKIKSLSECTSHGGKWSNMGCY